MISKHEKQECANPSAASNYSNMPWETIINSYIHLFGKISTSASCNFFKYACENYYTYCCGTRKKLIFILKSHIKSTQDSFLRCICLSNFMYPNSYRCDKLRQISIAKQAWLRVDLPLLAALTICWASCSAASSSLIPPWRLLASILHRNAT